MPALLPFATAVLIGYLLVRAVRPLAGAGPGWAVAVFELSLGAGLGVGVTSAVFFALLVAGTGYACRPSSLPTLSCSRFFSAFSFSGVAASLPRQAQGSPPFRTVSDGTGCWRWGWGHRSRWCSRACGLMRTAIPTDFGMPGPSGTSAPGSWPVRARYGETPSRRCSGERHPDYPLLLSGFIGRCWKVAGSYDTAVPIATAFLFFAATVALLVSCLALVRSLSAGLLAGLVLLTGTVYLQQPMAQFSDVPLAFYYLAALALISLAWLGGESRERVLLPLAGAAAASAAWTKNEGLLFLVVFAGCCALVEWRFSGWKKAASRALWLLLGMLPGLILVGWLKLLLAPVADPFVSRPIQSLSGGFARFERVWWVVRQAYKWAIGFGSGVSHPLVVLARAHRRRALRRPAEKRGARLDFGGDPDAGLWRLLPRQRGRLHALRSILLPALARVSPLGVHDSAAD